jgi:chaperonin GroES
VKDEVTFEPLNDFLLVEPITEDRSAGGLLLVQTDKTQRPDKGKVLAVGPGKYVDGKLEAMRCKVGDVLAFQQFPFFEVMHKGRKAYFIRELQVIALVK